MEESMKKTRTLCIVILAVIISSGISYAGQCHWLGTADSVYTNPNNWAEGYNPANDAVFNGVTGQEVINHQPEVGAGVSAQFASTMYIGISSPVTITIDGGTLDGTAASWLGIGLGWVPGNTSTINISSGSLTTTGFIALGYDGTGNLNMSGGHIQSTGITFGQQPDGVGHMQLDGGEIWLTGSFLMNQGTANITHGKVMAMGDQSERIQGYVNSGKLTGYGSASNIVISLTANPGYTTITAIPEPATLSLLGLGLIGFLKKR
jgi:hypothetical protein